MAPTLLCSTDPSALEERSPESTEQRLGRLIRRYVQQRSAAAARQIVIEIDTLCSDPRLVGDSRDRCAYLRLRKHWTWLADAHTVEHEV